MWGEGSLSENLLVFLHSLVIIGYSTTAILGISICLQISRRNLRLFWFPYGTQSEEIRNSSSSLMRLLKSDFSHATSFMRFFSFLFSHAIFFIRYRLMRFLSCNVSHAVSLMWFFSCGFFHATSLSQFLSCDSSHVISLILKNLKRNQFLFFNRVLKFLIYRSSAYNTT